MTGLIRARSRTTSCPDRGTPGRWSRAPGKHADRRRLSRAVVAEQAEDLTLGDRECDAVDRAHLPVMLLEAVHLDGGRAHAPGRRRVIQPMSQRAAGFRDSQVVNTMNSTQNMTIKRFSHGPSGPRSRRPAAIATDATR